VTRPPTPPASELTIRPETPDDIDAIRVLTTAAFGQLDEAEIVDALRESGNGIEGLSFVGLVGDEVIAHAMLSRCFVGKAPRQVDGEAPRNVGGENPDEARGAVPGSAPGVCLAPCSVSPDHQRTRVGTAVIKALLAEAARRGEAFAVVLGHPEYYPRFGFTPASGYGITLHVEVPDEALMAMPLAGDVPAGPLAFAPEFGV
jgi:putative acetyltransferase